MTSRSVLMNMTDDQAWTVSRLFGPIAWVMSLFVAGSTFGGVNGTLLTASRLFMCGAREGQMPGILTTIHTERSSILIYTLGVVAIIFNSQVDPSSKRDLPDPDVPLLLVLERPDPAHELRRLLHMALHRGHRALHPLPEMEVPAHGEAHQGQLVHPLQPLHRNNLNLEQVNLFFPILYLILTAIITLLPMIAKPVETAIGFCMILASVPVYIVFLVWKGKPKWLGNILGEGTNWLQRLLVVMPQVKNYIQNGKFSDPRFQEKTE